MGAKARAEMATAKARLEARKAEAFGPVAPPCQNCREPSKGTIIVHGEWKPVCSPLKCAYQLSGVLETRTWQPHPPGKYRSVP